MSLLRAIGLAIPWQAKCRSVDHATGVISTDRILSPLPGLYPLVFRDPGLRFRALSALSLARGYSLLPLRGMRREMGNNGQAIVSVARPPKPRTRFPMSIGRLRRISHTRRRWLGGHHFCRPRRGLMRETLVTPGCASGPFRPLRLPGATRFCPGGWMLEERSATTAKRSYR